MHRLPTRASWWMTAASFAWVWGLLSVAWPHRELVCVGLAAVFGVTTWIATRWPWPGVVLTSGALVVLGLLGIGTEDPAPLGPLFIVLVMVGYLVPPPWSVLAVPALGAATAIPARWDAQDIIFGGLLLLLPWWFGARVRARDARRQQAAADALRLANLDPEVQGRQAAAAERDEVAASAFEVIGRAVGQMRVSAAAARASLDAATITAIHRKGEEATQRLRALLVLLREEPSDGPDRPALPVPAEGPPATAADEQTWRQTLLNGWPALLVLVDVFATPFVMSALEGTVAPALPSAAFLVLVVAPLMVAVVLRDRFPEVVPWMAAAVLILGALVEPAELGRDGVWLMVVVIALAWSAGHTGTRLALAAWFAFTMTVGFLVFIDTPYYLPIYLAMGALPFGAGAVWSGHHAEEAAHLGLAQLRQQEIEAAERAAVSRERLGLARDLHDAASHAVGTMMMQANAAKVLRERDPQGARAALDAIVDIAREAGTELRDIRSAGDRAIYGTGPGHLPATTAGTSPAYGTAGEEERAHSRSTGDISEAIAPLVTAARRAGATVSTSLDLRTQPAPEDVVLLLRVVREGLANAARHAPGSDIVVEVSVIPARVLVVVSNGPPRPATRQDGAVTTSLGLGLGLRGLRELVGERRGEVSAGATDFGFELRASFPPHPAEQPVVPT
ncbi:hypothetical protein FNH13_18320 [Ornithinimicrobium ciconiae]|uniref:histidine kinase n=1 Tax=Ornithinimicrobium ciconiae TaxID=2594265 RepID=A0A516GET3_9MICO|nr:histidine kinase [Ornithinimicrobium ciconiae]QDO90039.1 hypothetical protein FNH13_18320 [Ornithinimicrobium ciconiae]